MAQSHCYFSFMKEDATVLVRSSSSFSSRFSLFSQSDSSYFIEMCPDVLATLRIGVLKSWWCSYCYYWYCCKEGHFIWCFSTIYSKRENDIFLHSRSLTPALTVSSSIVPFFILSYCTLCNALPNSFSTFSSNILFLSLYFDGFKNNALLLISQLFF